MPYTQLPFFAIIRVTGDDRHNFLHNQLSNDINNLNPNQACYASYNSPKGRVIANLIVANDGEALHLILSADLAEPVLKRLKMFVLRAKVQFEILDAHRLIAKLPEKLTISYPHHPVFAFPIEDGFIQLPNGAALHISDQADQFDYHAELVQRFTLHEIQCGYAWISLATSEVAVAQMLNLHQIGGVHFRKGCYPGQEVIARAQYRGQVKRGLALATTHHHLNPADKIFNAQNEEVGIVINACQQYTLLLIKHAAANDAIFDEQQQELKLQHCFFESTEHPQD